MQVQCDHCHKEFEKKPYEVKRTKRQFCTRLCWSKFCTGDNPPVMIKCKTCGKEVSKKPSDIHRKRAAFCDNSCAATFNNKKKRRSHRSKCEIMLSNLLQQEFPEMKIVNNDKEMLKGYEVDIGLPEIKLAVEWNGVVHYRPIYGIDVFKKRQRIDREKVALAGALGIDLVVVPDLVSTASRVKEAFSEISEIVRHKQKHKV